jgi:hypothetical protein
MLFALISTWGSVMVLATAFGTREAVLGFVGSVLITVLLRARL